jgi:hypothetical protein
VQLFTIGIVMEMLIRTYYESQNKRPYRLKGVWNASTDYKQ